MNSKIKEAEKFLRSLEDPSNTIALMDERVDVKLLLVLNNYAEFVTKKRANLELTDKDIIASSMVVGYLLKSHMDRFDLEKALYGMDLGI